MAAPDPVFKNGDEIEGLRVQGQLGQGGASVIYLVQALKHVHRGDAKDERFLQQTIQEYEVASKLNHPSMRKVSKIWKKTRRLVQLTDVFLVMEFFDGRSMDVKPPPP